jgi:hypothetical protein
MNSVSHFLAGRILPAKVGRNGISVPQPPSYLLTTFVQYVAPSVPNQQRADSVEAVDGAQFRRHERALVP